MNPGATAITDTQTNIFDWASLYLSDAVPLEEFCAVFERWWHGDRTGLSEREMSAARNVIDAIAWFSGGREACIPVDKRRDERAVRNALMAFLECHARGPNGSR